MKPIINFTSIEYDKEEGIVRRIPIYEKTDKEKYKTLVDFMKNKGYAISNVLSQSNDYSDVLVVVVDNLNKEIHTCGPTAMVMWSVGGREPMDVDELLNNYERINEKNDIDFYYEFIRNKRIKAEEEIRKRRLNKL